MIKKWLKCMLMDDAPSFKEECQMGERNLTRGIYGGSMA